MTLSRKQIFVRVFKDSVSAFPFVARNISIYFASYWIPAMIFILFLLHHFLPPLPAKNYLVGLFDRMFTIFIVPYWAYVFIKKSSFYQFWDFIRENITPFVINSIKAFFIVVFSPVLDFVSLIKSTFLLLTGKASLKRFFHFLILLFIGLPPIFVPFDDIAFSLKLYLGFLAFLSFISWIKGMLQIFLITTTTLFCENKGEAIKESRRLSKGLLIFLFICFFVLFPSLLTLASFSIKMIFYVIQLVVGVPFKFIEGSISYTLGFYLQAFVYIFMTNLYFLLEKIK